MKGNYRDQVKRLIRSFNKLPKQHFQKRLDSRTMDNYYHFFQDCWHLKDWMRNDLKLDISIKNNIENFINRSNTLSLIGDLANATKHLILKHPARKDKNIDFEILDSSDSNKMITVKTKDKGNYHYYGSSLLPLRALQEWNKFFRKHKLDQIDIIKK